MKILGEVYFLKISNLVRAFLGHPNPPKDEDMREKSGWEGWREGGQSSKENPLLVWLPRNSNFFLQELQVFPFLLLWFIRYSIEFISWFFGRDVVEVHKYSIQFLFIFLFLFNLECANKNLEFQPSKNEKKLCKLSEDKRKV